MKSTMQTTLYLFLRIVLVCILAAMSIPITSFATDITIPILAVFYFLMIMYFFIFTAWTVGGKDVIANNRTKQKPFMAKGFVAAGIVAVFLAIVFFMPNVISSTMGSSNSIFLIFYFLKLGFTMFSAYPLVWTHSLVSGISMSSDEVMGDTFSSVAATIVYFAIIVCCVIGAGVGYIVGYKQIKIIQPWLDKWKRE
ncbi:MAG: hypothetical protein DBX47_02065 [Clostridiales bacterium]|nr:MAG: hypothetical protein DBX47_02065 [Clostridiales bacterium]